MKNKVMNSAPHTHEEQLYSCLIRALSPYWARRVLPTNGERINV